MNTIPRGRYALAFLVGVACSAIATFASAESLGALSSEFESDTLTGDVGRGGSTRAFGTATDSILNLQALAGCQGWEADDDNAMRASGGRRYCAESCILECQVTLPSGAQVNLLGITANDTNAAGQVTANLLHCVDFAGGCNSEGQVATGFSETPGLDYFDIDLDHTIDNSDASYIIQMVLSGGTSATSFESVYLFWKRQISPAPGTATFLDVPTSHQFFTEIEALVAADITTGCGGGRYCPDNPVTRGQMAVFLSRALGLHWEL